MRTGGWLDIQSALWFLVSLTNSTVPALEFAPWHSCTLIDLIRFDWFDLIRLPRPWWSSRSPQSSHCGMEWRRIRLERTDSMCSTMHRSIDRWSVGRMIQWMESINQSLHLQQAVRWPCWLFWLPTHLKPQCVMYSTRCTKNELPQLDGSDGGSTRSLARLAYSVNSLTDSLALSKCLQAVWRNRCL